MTVSVEINTFSESNSFKEVHKEHAADLEMTTVNSSSVVAVNIPDLLIKRDLYFSIYINAESVPHQTYTFVKLPYDTGEKTSWLQWEDDYLKCNFRPTKPYFIPFHGFRYQL